MMRHVDSSMYTYNANIKQELCDSIRTVINKILIRVILFARFNQNIPSVYTISDWNEKTHYFKDKMALTFSLTRRYLSTRVLQWRENTIIKAQNEKKIMQNFAYLYDLHFASTKYRITMVELSGGSSVSQNKLPLLILRYIYILKYLQSNFIG